MKMYNVFLATFLAVSLSAMAEEAKEMHDHSQHGAAHEHNHEGEVPEDIQAGVIDEQGTLITVKAKGLVCDFCARALEKVFMKREEVSGINVDLDKATILVSLKQDAQMSDEEVTKLITDSGYNIGGIERH